MGVAAAVCEFGWDTCSAFKDQTSLAAVGVRGYFCLAEIDAFSF